jgi:hypothetical protein
LIPDTCLIQGRHDASHVAAFIYLGKVSVLFLTHMSNVLRAYWGTHGDVLAGLRVIGSMTHRFQNLRLLSTITRNSFELQVRVRK